MGCVCVRAWQVSGLSTSPLSVVNYSAPVIASFSPAALSTAGGRLTIAGANFGTAPVVTINGVVCLGVTAAHVRNHLAPACVCVLSRFFLRFA